MPVLPATPDAIARAADVLRAGGLVAFPTETVYGLGAHALDADAVARIYAAKGRPEFNPLIVHVADVEGARALTAVWPAEAERLAARFWPGPLTLVLPKRAVVPDAVTAGLPSVAVRVPAHPVAMALLRAAELPVAAPSANRFTELSPTSAEHVRRALGERVDVILDGGDTEVGIESTVLDLTGSWPRLLRPGMIGADALIEVVGPIHAAPVTSADAPRPAPGMLERHYAPRAELRLFGDADRDAVREWAARAARRGDLVGALLVDPSPTPRPARWSEAGIARVLVLPADPAGYARRLYAALHELDNAGCTLVFVERPPASPAWEGVHDRLRRAAAGEV